MTEVREQLLISSNVMAISGGASRRGEKEHSRDLYIAEPSLLSFCSVLYFCHRLLIRLQLICKKFLELISKKSWV